MKKLVLLLVLLALVGGIGWRLMQVSEQKAKKMEVSKPPTAVSVATAARKDVPFTLSAVGNVVTNETVAVRSRIDSQLMEVKFRDGDEVKAGDLLFVLDDRALKAQVQQLEANLVRDRAQLGNLKRQLERKQGLADKGYETASNLDEARAQFQVQAATVAATAATIENIKVQLQYTGITAPISGRTGTINTTVGNTVKANDTTPLVTINQVKPVRVMVAIPEKHLAALRAALAGGGVGVTARGEGGKAAEGQLDYIDNAIDSTTGTVKAGATFANDDEALWPGMFVTATIRLADEKGVMTVPEVSVQRGQDGDFVFVAEGGRALKRPVTVGRMQDGTAVIAQGLKEGEQVVTDGMMKLEDGSEVVMPGAGEAK